MLVGELGAVAEELLRAVEVEEGLRAAMSGVQWSENPEHAERAAELERMRLLAGSAREDVVRVWNERGLTSVTAAILQDLAPLARHVWDVEVRNVWDALRPGEVLAFYQHGKRDEHHHRLWIEARRPLFEGLLDAPVSVAHAANAPWPVACYFDRLCGG